MKSAMTRIKGILLALMYAALYPIIELTAYRIYILWLHLGGGLSASEIEKIANKNSFAISIVISAVSIMIYLGICKLRKKKFSEYIQVKKTPLMIFVMAAIVAIGTRLAVEVYCTLIQSLEIFKKSIIESATVAPRLSTRLEFSTLAVLLSLSPPLLSLQATTSVADIANDNTSINVFFILFIFFTSYRLIVFLQKWEAPSGG